MIRLIGILIGAALAIATLILVIGLPQFSAPEPGPVIEAERPDRVAASEDVSQRTDALSEAVMRRNPHPRTVPHWSHRTRRRNLPPRTDRP